MAKQRERESKMKFEEYLDVRRKKYEYKCESNYDEVGSMFHALR
jgi:hypothetical protein